MLTNTLLHFLIAFSLSYNLVFIIISMFEISEIKKHHPVFLAKTFLVYGSFIIYTILEIYLASSWVICLIFLFVFLFFKSDLFQGLLDIAAKGVFFIYVVAPFCLFAIYLILNPNLLEDKNVFNMCIALFILTIYQISHCGDIFKYICESSETQSSETQIMKKNRTLPITIAIIIVIYSIYLLISSINNSIQDSISIRIAQDMKEKSCVDTEGYQLDSKTLTKIKNSSQYSLGSMFDDIQEKARKELKQKYIELSKKSDSFFIIEDENLISDIRTLEEIEEEMKNRKNSCCKGKNKTENICSMFYYFSCGGNFFDSSWTKYNIAIYKDYYYCGKNTTRRKQ